MTQPSYEVESEASVTVNNSHFLEQGKALSRVYTKDESLDRYGKAGMKGQTGGWRYARLLLVCEVFAALACTGFEVNMVLFSKTVLRQSNADAATMFTKWMGSLNMFALIGAFLSDSYLGSYLTCITFQIVLALGLGILSVSTHLFMLEPKGCGRIGELCNAKSFGEFAIFYLSIYLVSLGSGAMEPALGTLGADQFEDEDEDEDEDEGGEDSQENQTRNRFFSYYYVALNVGSLIGETFLVYLENLGMWELAFWISASCGFFSVLLLFYGQNKFRRLKPSGNPISRFSHVIVASVRNFKLKLPSHGEGLYEYHGMDKNTTRKIPHTDDFRFLDRAALVTPSDMGFTVECGKTPNPWRLCTVTQVEEVKCILRLLPIWFCTILASVVFVQVFSLFVEQGAAMNTVVLHGFRMPPASMTIFDIVSTSTFIICYEHLLVPFYVRVMHTKPKPPNELQRIGIGFVIAIVAMTIAGFVEQKRLRYADLSADKETSSLSIFWQTPQYVLVGVAEAFIIVAQWEFFTAQTPDSLKCLGLGLSMSSSAFGSYLCGVILTVVMKISTKNGKPGWVPPNLNSGHLDRFFFLSAASTALALVLFVLAAKRFKGITQEKRDASAQKHEMEDITK